MILTSLFTISSYGQSYFKKFYTSPSLGNYMTQSHIQVCKDNSYISLRHHADSVYLSKYDECGNTIWTTGLQLEFEAETVSLKLSDGDKPIIALSGFDVGKSRIVVIKISSDGQSVLWSKKYRSIQNIYFFQFEISDDGSLWFGTLFNNTDVGLIKMDSVGSVTHAAIYDEMDWVGYLGFTFIDRNSLMLVKEKSLIRIDSIGNISWKANYSDLINVMGIVPVQDGFLVGGHILANRTVTFKIDNSGNVKTDRKLAANFWGQNLRKHNDGRIFFVGHNEMDSAGWNRTTEPSIMELDETGTFVKNLQLGTNVVMGNISDLWSVESLGDDLIIDATIFRPNSNSLRLIGKVSMDEDKHLCEDSSYVDRKNINRVVRTFKTPKTVVPVSISDTIYNVSFIPFHSTFLTQCEPFHDYSKLFKNDSLSLCSGDTIPFDSSFHPSSVLWSTNETSNDIYITQSGAYWVALTFPCDPQVYYDTLFVEISKRPQVNISITPKQADINTSISFQCDSLNNNDRVVWDFGDGETSSVESALHSYQRSGKYIITLNVMDPNGCSYQYHDTVFINAKDLVIPNIFTPNGDGQNDMMEITGDDIQSYTLNVYDRNGAQVISLNNLSWDGNSHNGQPAADGVYFYILEYTLWSNEQKKVKGSVTLIRGGW
ncbi:gliding motility-associated C-terminal domain-containing protein [Owenweeksia hongkongensis]|uniref:T9SS type B sorting domain-containing protein n=1 Tax=Owenweeksia hongkongensis TaxID=253245 RepID=UPI003A94273B